MPESTLTPDLAKFIRSAPKTETHLHIEGALPWECLQSLDNEKFGQAPEVWDPHYRYESFDAFNTFLLDHALQWFTSPERYHEAAKLTFARLLAENVRYVETSFHGGIIEFLQVPGKAIVDAILSAVPEGLNVRLFMGMTRDGGSDYFLEAIDNCWNWEGLAGIDLHGVELLPIESWTKQFWKRAGQEGLELKAHAGEFGGPEAVREVIEELGVKRVQHGVRASEDREVVQVLKDQGVVLDICPLSNLKLGVVPSLEEHPIIDLLNEGIHCTVSTDDPFAFGNTIVDEYEALALAHQLDQERIAKLMANGFRAADMDETLRSDYIQELSKKEPS